jgi:hypothetical protein
MASKKARAFLRSLGIDDSAHTGVERGNFAAGRGLGITTLDWHIVRFDRETGDSKTTVDYATDSTVGDKLAALRSANTGRYGHYARNVRTGAIRK